MSEQIHEVYLPYTKEELEPHFLSNVPQAHLQHYTSSAERYRKGYRRSKFDRQIEKDERFWTVATLKHIFDQGLFGQLLAKAFGDAPPLEDFDTWEECLEGNLHLFFERDLPCPPSYPEWLREHLRERQMVPHLLEVLKASEQVRLEGETQVDALLLNEQNGFAVAFESKVLSDIACEATYDTLRNQFARLLDVLLEKGDEDKLPDELLWRNPDRTLVVLLTPRLFYENRSARYYGWLFDDYSKNPASLARDLPHREADWEAVARRLGWTTFEDCNAIAPGCCKWMQ
jgi:hypothetical protein